MVNKIKRFFKSIGKPSSSGSASMSSSSSMGAGYPVLATSDNQFHQQYESRTNNNNSSSSSHKLPLSNSPSFGLVMDGNQMMQATEASSSGSESMTSPYRPGSAEVLKWGVLLSKIPKLVAEATSPTISPGSGSPRSDNASSGECVEMSVLLELLTQMASKECQAQILQYYSGETNNPIGSSGASTGK